MKQISFVLVVIVLFAFLGILFISDLAGRFFGGNAEIISLVIIAALLVVLLIINHRSGGGEDDHGSDGV
jgi:hypothetical protein